MTTEAESGVAGLQAQDGRGFPGSQEKARKDSSLEPAGGSTALLRPSFQTSGFQNSGRYISVALSHSVVAGHGGHRK